MGVEEPGNGHHRAAGFVSADLIQSCAQLALDSIQREYPYHLTHVLEEPGAVESPRSLTPVFYGCFDWHSAVHGHWLLVRALRTLPAGPSSEACRALLHAQLTPAALQREADYVRSRPEFERPYGLAWLLQLTAELESFSGDPDALAWREAIRPLEAAARASLAHWLPKLTHPVRCGTHPQTAFNLVLVLDWARVVDDDQMCGLIEERAHTFFGADRHYALHLEPSGEDFLSPALGAAWLMTRVLDEGRLQAWLSSTMEELGRGFRFEAVSAADRSDGRLAHLDGLNLSRAWMLHEVAVALPGDDQRREALAASAQAHLDIGLESIHGAYYAGTHWLGTFAAYALGTMR